MNQNTPVKQSIFAVLAALMASGEVKPTPMGQREIAHDLLWSINDDWDYDETNAREVDVTVFSVTVGYGRLDE